MTTLVAGNAALHDLIATSDDPASTSSIGVLRDGPGVRGRWLPGGAAPTVGLALIRRGIHVALWHALPPALDDDSALDLAIAGMDLSRCPRVDGAGHCVLIRVGEDAVAWSSRVDAPAQVDGDLLNGIDHVVVCPVWGRWTEQLLALALGSGIRCSLVGTLPDAALAYRWRAVIVNERQLSSEVALRVDADVLAVTSGSRGSRVRLGGAWRVLPAAPTRVVDPTGAGDVYAGTLIGALEEGRDLDTAAALASKEAARCCEHWGAQTSLRQPVPSAATDQAARVRGALWGLACGDAFGMPAAFLEPEVRLRQLGTITDLVAAPRESPYHAGYPAGRVTDDTEQALAVTRAFLDSDGSLRPEAVARELSAWLDSVGGPDARAVGPSTRRGLLAWREGVDVQHSGRHGTSNGGAMRITPVGIVSGMRGGGLEALIDEVVAACLVTHNTSVAISAASAVAAAVSAGISGAPWSAMLTTGMDAADRATGRGAWVYAPDVASRIELAWRQAVDSESDAVYLRRLSRLIGTGEPAAEAVPAAFGIAARAHGQPELAIKLAGNLEGDSDTIGAMAGAICGSYAGDAAIPARWCATVSAVNGIDIERWVHQLERIASSAILRGAS